MVTLRVGLGLIFLWSFVDKLFGLGFATCVDKKSGKFEMLCDGAWINGGSPTFGFLNFSSHGPLADIFKQMAGNPVVDWLFMLGLLFIGICLVIGIALRLSGFFGFIMMTLMYLAAMPPEHHPFMDEHVIYAVILLSIMMGNSSGNCPVSRWWKNSNLVQKFSILK